MADIKEAFGTVTPMTTTALQSIAASATAGWQSDFVDNSADLYPEALVIVTIVASATGATANDKGVSVFAYASIDGGTTYTENVTGAQGTYTFPTDRQLKQIGFIPVTAVSATYKGGPFAVSPAFGGFLPPRWGIAILNNTGFTLSTGNVVKYLGAYATSV